MKVRKIDTPVELERLLQEDDVIVKFFATWCGPCKMMEPIMEQLAEKHPNVLVIKADVEEVGDIAGQFNIMSVPTIIRLQKGKAIAKATGYHVLEALEEKLKL